MWRHLFLQGSPANSARRFLYLDLYSFFLSISCRQRGEMRQERLDRHVSNLSVLGKPFSAKAQLTKAYVVQAPGVTIEL